MSFFDLWGPWTGAALRSHAPIPYYRQRRRKALIAVAVTITIGAVITAGLWAVNH